MGKVRTCDQRCHGAKQPACDCWCGGKFHGAAGERRKQLDHLCRVALCVNPAHLELVTRTENIRRQHQANGWGRYAA